MKWNLLRSCRIFSFKLIALMLGAPLSVAGGVNQLNEHQIYPCSADSASAAIPVGEDQVCGKVFRLENPQDSNSRLIDIHYLKLPAKTAATRPPLLFIQGGPGGDAIPLAWHVRWAFRQLNLDRDFIFVDLRGTGKSHALNCEGMTTSFFSADNEKDTEQALDACMARLKEKSAFYTTPIFVDDLEAIRQTLGYQKWALWSVSYGGRVALDYMARYPQQVDSAVLDSPGPVTIALPSQLPKVLEQGLKQVAAACKADSLCFNAYGDAWQNAQKIAAALEQAPYTFRLKPEGVTSQPPYHVSAFSFANAINAFFYSRQTYSQLSEALWRATQNDWSIFVAIDKLFQTNSSIAFGTHFLVICNEDRALWPSDGWSAFLGQDVGYFYKRACSHFAAPTSVSSLQQPIAANIPTLILSGENDVVTPHQVANTLAEQLPNAQIIRVKNGTHAVSFEGCIPELITQFVMAPMQKINSQGCEDRIAAKPLYKGGLGQSHGDSHD